REILRRRYPGLPEEVKIVLAPNQADISDERLKALLRGWAPYRSKKTGLADRSIIETAEFAPLLRNVMLLEIERPTPFEFDFVYRIYGDDMEARYGQDMTGKRTSEFPSTVAKMFMDFYELSIDSRAPIYTEHAPPLNVDVMLWERLILPLGEKDVEWIVTVNLPKGSRTTPESLSDQDPLADPEIVYLD
ncbi:MAG: hypothetical protein O3B74_13020, partial [Proteobacteria bacterium]|nr:hypothetical protein [Pseudomonadota bacterium]